MNALYNLNSTRRNGYFSILTAVLQKFKIPLQVGIENSAKKYKLNRFDSKNFPRICELDDFKCLKRLKEEGLIDELFDTFHIVEVGEDHETNEETEKDEAVAPDSIRLMIKSECPGKPEIVVTLKREQSFVDLRSFLMEKDGYFRALEAPVSRKVKKYSFVKKRAENEEQKLRELEAAEVAGCRTGQRMGIRVDKGAAVNTTKKVSEGTLRFKTKMFGKKHVF